MLDRNPVWPENKNHNNMQLNDLANWAAEQQQQDVGEMPFVQIQTTPQWQNFVSSKKPGLHQVVYSKTATLSLVVDALCNNVKVHPQHALLPFAFTPSSTAPVFLVLKRWDDSEAFAAAAAELKISEPCIICLPENEYSNVKQVVLKHSYQISTILIPQLLRNTKNNDALAVACCEWLISLFYLESYSSPKSAVPRMMKSVLNITAALNDKGQSPMAVSVLRWTLQQNENRFPGVHRAVRSALLQDLANSLTTSQEQIPCYRESIALDLLDLRQDPQTHQQFLIKRIANNTRLVADLFHSEQDFRGELDTIHELCSLYAEWPRYPTYQLEFTQDLRRCALLCQILLAKMRKQRNPKLLQLIKKASAPPSAEEREILLRGVQVLEKILQVNREPTGMFFRDFHTEFVQLAGMYTDLEDFAQAERVYEEIFGFMQRFGYSADCSLLVSFADVLKKRNSFHLSALHINRALEVQTLQNGGNLLCQENVNHLTRLELVYESARFNLGILIGHLQEHIAHISNALLAQANAEGESTGSGNDIKTKLKEDFPDSASEAGDFHHPNEQLEHINDDLSRFTPPPHESWAAQAEIEMLHCSSDDAELQFYVTALNRAHVLMAFAECMRDDAQRKAISLSKTLYHRAMQESKLNLLQPKFLKAVEFADLAVIVDLADDVAVLCRQLGRGDQALFARNASVMSRIAMSTVDAALVNEIDEVAIEYFTFGLFTEAVRMFALVVQYSTDLGLDSLKVKAICNKAKALECVNTKASLQEATHLYLLCNDLFPRQSPERLLVLRALFDCLVLQAATQAAEEEILDQIQVCAKQIIPLLPRAEAVPFLIRLCQLLLFYENVEDAEAFCHEASALAESDSMNMYHVMEMRIAVCRQYDDWDLTERHCQEALRILKCLVHNERDIYHFYGTVQIPLWLEHAEMLQFGTAGAVDLLNEVVHHCDLAIQFTRRTNDNLFAIRFCEHRGDAFFQLEAFDKAYASYQLGYLYSGEDNTALADKMDRVRDALEDPETTDSFADCNSARELYDEDEESGSSRTDEYYYGDEDEESSLGGSIKEEVEEGLAPRLEALHVNEEEEEEEEELPKPFARQAEKRSWSNV